MMGNFSDHLFGALLLEGYCTVEMYEQGMSLADTILAKCERMQLDATAGKAGIFRMKANMLIELALANPNENRQFRLKESENCLIRAFELVKNRENRFQEVSCMFCTLSEEVSCKVTLGKLRLHFGDVMQRIEAIELLQEELKNFPNEDRPIFNELNYVLNDLQLVTFQ